jgi:hypothetical protein
VDFHLLSVRDFGFDVIGAELKISFSTRRGLSKAFYLWQATTPSQQLWI